MMNAHAAPAPLDPSLDGLAVEVYRNLHSGGYSIRHRGRVIAHAPEVFLSVASFRVGAAGRARCLATGRKNVHAFVRGTLIARPLGRGEDGAADLVRASKAGADLWPGLTYNPRDGVEGFHLRAPYPGIRADEPLAGASCVALSGEGAACYNPTTAR